MDVWNAWKIPFFFFLNIKVIFYFYISYKKMNFCGWYEKKKYDSVIYISIRQDYSTTTEWTWTTTSYSESIFDTRFIIKFKNSFYCTLLQHVIVEILGYNSKRYRFSLIIFWLDKWFIPFFHTKYSTILLQCFLTYYMIRITR